MIVTIDTREQNELVFEGADGVTEVVHRGLDYGDYECKWNPEDGKSGFVANPIVFERKTIPDLYSTLTSGATRFKKEIERAKLDGGELIIMVEGTDKQVLAGIKHSTIKGTQIMRTVDTLEQRYGVQTKFCATRETMVWRMVNIWRTFFREWKKKQAPSAKSSGY